MVERSVVVTLLSGLLLLAQSGAAQNTVVYLRSGGPSAARLTTCTNAAPVVCTTQAAHRLSAGQTVVLSNAVGNTAVNGLRKVRDVLSATQFSLNNFDGTPLAGNGAWQTGGTLNGGPSQKLVGKVNPFTLRAHPRILLDGEGGTFARRLRCAVDSGCLTSIAVAGGAGTVNVPGGHGLSVGAQFGIWNATATGLNGTYTVTAVTATSYSFATAMPNGTYNNTLLGVSEYAFTGNLAWESLVNLVTEFTPNYQKMNANPTMERYLAAALVWYTDRNHTTALNMARWAVNHAEDSFYGTGVCNLAIPFCGWRTGTDYSRFNTVNLAAIYSILRSANQVDAGESALYAAKMLNDLDTSCTLPPLVTGAGTVTATNGLTTVTGTGTAFTTAFAPGDSIFLPFFANDEYVYRIESIQNDTQMTLSQPISTGGFSGAYQHARAWQPGDCGALFLMKTHTSSVVGDPAQYPPRGASEASFYGNLSLTAFWAYTHLGLALAEEPRGKALLEAAWLFGYDQLLGYSMSSWTGLTQAGSVYHWYRSPWMGADLAYTARHIIQGYPDLVTAGPAWLKNILPLTYYSFLPFGNYNLGTAFGPLFGEGSLTVDPYWLSYQSRVTRLFETEPEAASWRGWLKNRYGYTLNSIAYNGRQGAINYYLGVNPNLPAADHTALPTQYLLSGNGFAACAPLEMALCTGPDRQYAMAVSRTGWTDAADSQIQLYGGTYETDHFENLAGDYRIVKGVAGGTTPCLLGADSSQCATAYGGLFRNNLLEIGTGYARRAGAGDAPIASFARWAGPRPAGDAQSRYAYAMVDLTGVFRATYSAQRARRHFAHFKHAPETEEILVVYDDVSIGTPSSIRAYTHFSQNGQSGEGATTCPGTGTCSTTHIADGRVLSQSTSHTLVTQYLSPHPSTGFRLYVDNANGSYTGGSNFTYRLTYCASRDRVTCSTSANALESIVVHRIVPGVGDTTLAATLLSPSSAWTGVQTASTVSLFARQGGLPNAVPAFTTTHAGTARYLITGLAAGVYNVSRNGAPLAAGVTVAAGDHTLYFSGDAGTYTVDLATPALSGASADVSNLSALAAYLPGTPLACTWQVASDAGMTNVLASGADEPGMPWRQAAATTGLTAGSTAYFRSQCNAAARYAVINTPSAPQTGTRNVVFSVRPLASLGADNVLVQWGPSAGSLTSAMSVSCTSGCSPSITGTANGVLFVRLFYRSGITIRASTETRRVLVH
ncbi:MAG: hypothetical protein IT162_12385 [Bryobacterales bacterium]|nr:hypothetical protein [Bryobacterales bacterium]